MCLSVRAHVCKKNVRLFTGCKEHLFLDDAESFGVFCCLFLFSKISIIIMCYVDGEREK